DWLLRSQHGRRRRPARLRLARRPHRRGGVPRRPARPRRRRAIRGSRPDPADRGRPRRRRARSQPAGGGSAALRAPLGGRARRLIAERGFSFVAVEGDWPDCFRINRWVKGRADADLSARAVLDRFERWPTWMWANQEVAAFVDWLRDHNQSTGANIGFFGLDV